MEVSDDDIRPISGNRRRRKNVTESPVEEDTPHKKAKTKRARVKKISSSTDSDDASDDDDCFTGSDVEAHFSPNTRDRYVRSLSKLLHKLRRDRKSRLIAQVLSRWWYVMVRWPPEDFDYALELRKRTLRQVSFDNWEYEDDIDAFGYTKVYEITHFPGVYRNPKGEIIDLRPTEGKPCYSNLVKKSELELYEMLYTALTNQISDLATSPYISTDKSVIEKIREDLSREMKFVQTNLHRLKSGTPR